MPDQPYTEAEVPSELTDPYFSGVMSDPIILVLDRHWWLRTGELEGMCGCGFPGESTTPLGYKQHVRRELLAALTAAASVRQGELERLRDEYAELFEHHRQCELAGTRLAELVKREVTGEGPLPPVDDNVLMEAVEAWDAHQ